MIAKDYLTKILCLSFAAQVAWVVENQYFNLYLFEHITPDLRPVAWIVTASAITAALSSLLLGTFSDRLHSRWGRRRPLIFIGYLAWGLMIALFPISASFKPLSLAISIAIMVDCALTLFGAASGGAVLDALITETINTNNRDRVSGSIEVVTWLVTQYGAPMVLNGQAGFTPSPLLFQAAAFFTLVAGLPLLYLSPQTA